MIDHYDPHIVTAQDYYPFGMLSRVALPNSGVPYKFGFNGKLNDNDVKGGLGNQIDYGARVYDPRIGKFLSLDPLQAKFPFYSPYQFAGNKPIWAIDLDGQEEYIYNLVLTKNRDGKPVLAFQFSKKREYDPVSRKFGQLMGSTATYYLMYNGEQVGAYNSEQEMRSEAHGKTVDQLLKIQTENDRRFIAAGAILAATESVKAPEKRGRVRGTAVAEEAAARSKVITEVLKEEVLVLPRQQSRTFNHFTNIEGATGITGINVKTLENLKVGESITVTELGFGEGTNTFLQNAPKDIFVTDLPIDVTSRQLKDIGVWPEKQGFAISFSEEEAFFQGVKVRGAKSDRGIYTIPANTQLKGTFKITRTKH